MHTVYLLLGSNKGDRLKYLLLAKYFLQQQAGDVLQSSKVYVTEPWGKLNQPRYLNQALLMKTDKSPLQLLKIAQKIEKGLGRSNKHHYSARIIDIDILFFDDVILRAKNLTIPHPRLHLRNFTLQPLHELSATYSHPVLKKTIEQLAKDCDDTGKVSIFKTEK
jgi:2-amino-4-hydroxy-6-hydroxymethyldihydropteridine diphosphokinase